MKYCVKITTPTGYTAYLNVNRRTAWTLATAKRHREEFLQNFPAYQAAEQEIAKYAQGNEWNILSIKTLSRDFLARSRELDEVNQRLATEQLKREAAETKVNGLAWDVAELKVQNESLNALWKESKDTLVQQSGFYKQLENAHDELKADCSRWSQQYSLVASERDQLTQKLADEKHKREVAEDYAKALEGALKAYPEVVRQRDDLLESEQKLKSRIAIQAANFRFQEGRYERLSEKFNQLKSLIERAHHSTKATDF